MQNFVYHKVINRNIAGSIYVSIWKNLDIFNPFFVMKDEINIATKIFIEIKL